MKIFFLLVLHCLRSFVYFMSFQGSTVEQSKDLVAGRSEANSSIHFDILEQNRENTEHNIDKVKQQADNADNDDNYYEELLAKAFQDEQLTADVEGAEASESKATCDKPPDSSSAEKIADVEKPDKGNVDDDNQTSDKNTECFSMEFSVNVECGREEEPMDVDTVVPKDDTGTNTIEANMADVCRPKEYPKPVPIVESVDDEESVLNKEFLAVQFAAMQISAMKAVQCVLVSQKYGEMLLVPKSDLVADSSKAFADGTVVRKDEDFKKVICEYMKKLVFVASSVSPFKRVIEIDELDRTRAMLQKISLQEQAERKTNLPQLKGNLFT